MRKIIKLFACSILFVLCSIGMTSSDKNIKSVESSDELIDSIVNLALEDAEFKIDDYVDINYFVNLKESTSMLVDNIQFLSTKVEDEQVSDDIDEIQYETLTTSITNIFDNLSYEEYDVFKTLARDDSDIAEMLELIECDFETKSIFNESNSNTIKTANIVTLSTGVLEIGSILSMQNVCSAAIVAIKGAFNSMIATLKAFFVPNSVKAVVITASILIISTVVIVNWNKIKPVFNQIVDIFVNNAKKLASTVTRVFSSIKNLAIESESHKDVADNATSQNQMQKQVEKGQAPKDVDRVDKAHSEYGQDHVHFKDGTAINKDGSIHDDSHGTPKLTKKTLDWLNKNGWCLNGIKSN